MSGRQSIGCEGRIFDKKDNGKKEKRVKDRY